MLLFARPLIERQPQNEMATKLTVQLSWEAIFVFAFQFWMRAAWSLIAKKKKFSLTIIGLATELELARQNAPRF